mgnify:CR=1 FL=1
MNKQQQFKEQLEQLAEKFGYEIQNVVFSHVTTSDFVTEKEFDKVDIEMTTTDFSTEPIETTEHKESVFDGMFQMLVEETGGRLIELPQNHPYRIVSTMLHIAEKGGETEEAWRMFTVLLGLIHGDLK